MVVVDTSVFIDLFRGRNSETLQTLLVGGAVLISTTVYLELVQGVRKSEVVALRRFFSLLAEPLAWPSREVCFKVLRAARGSGLNIGIPDILILSDAVENSARLMTKDRQLALLAYRVGVTLMEFEAL